MTQVTTKTVQIIARVEFKNNPKAVLYIVRSSNGVDKYETTIYNGKATGCTCPAYSKCYHKTQLEIIEAQRGFQVASVVAQAEEIIAEAAKTPEEIKTESQIESYVRQGVSRSTAEAIVLAKGVKSHGNAKAFEPKAFSLLK